MSRRVKLGQRVQGDTAPADQQGYTLRDDEPPADVRDDSDDSPLNRYLNYVLAAMGILVLAFVLFNLIKGPTARHGSIVAEIQKENALAGIESAPEREQIMAQALRVDRAEALGNTAQIRQELERLMMMGKSDPQSRLNPLCVKRLRSLK